MRNLKKFLALILAMMMTFSLMATVNASSFEDDDDITDDYAEAVDVLTGLKVIKGYENADKTFDFKPKSNITRGEVAAILYRIVTGDVKDASIHLYKHESEFTDVYATDWYAPYVNFCSNNGLVKGVGDNRFNPNGNITGYEALVMILRAIGYNNPSEFTSSDWKFKASGYGSRLGLTTNIPAGSLGGAATRESVAEIMFQGLLAPTVSYSPLTMYTENLLVDASEVNATATGVVYAADVKSNLMYETFKIVGKRSILVNDGTYGRPVVEWVKDAKDDTVENGGKYIVNPQKATATAYTAAKNEGVFTGASGGTVAAGAVYVPSTTPAARYANADSWTDPTTYTADPNKTDRTALSITMTPVKTYTDVVDECTLSKDINADRAIPAANLTEWLNGRLAKTRDNQLDALHTREATLNAAGRTLEVYQIASDPTPGSSHTFVFVYFDTLMGVVDKVVPRTFDTNKHVMSDAELHINVNNGGFTVIDTDDASDYDEYKKGDLVLFTTWGGRSYDTTGAGKVDQNLGTAQRKFYRGEQLQKIIPQRDKDFLWCDSDATTWAVDVLDEKPTTETFTIQSTVGARMVKSGVVSTDGKAYPGNVVYLANEVDSFNVTVLTPTYFVGYADPDYATAGASLFDGEPTVPNSPTDYGVPMINEKIGKTVTAVLDKNGYVVGMTEEVVSSDIGVITGMDTVRIGVAKYAVEAEMFMIDGSTKTVRFLDNAPAQDAQHPEVATAKTDGTDSLNAAGKSVTPDYFLTSTAADDSFDPNNAGSTQRHLYAVVNTLIKIEPFTRDGETYYHIVETGAGKNTVFDSSSTVVADNDGTVATGVAETLTALANTAYKASPAAARDNLDNNTKFIIGEADYRYNNGSGANVGGYQDMIRTAYKGFKNIPTITGTAAHILTQRIGNNVYIYPDMAQGGNLVYNLSNKQTVPVDETYLVLAPVATYADHSTYKVLKDGEVMELDVSNANNGAGTPPNEKFEDTLDPTNAAYGQLVVVTGKSTKGYVTSALYLSDAPYSASRTIEAGHGVYFNDTGVIAVDSTTDNTAGNNTLAGAGTNKFLTVADNCAVQIVNLLTGVVTPGSLSNIMQYEKFTDAAGDSHAFVYELDNLGYVSHIYILD